MKICSNCGRKGNNNDRVCAFCGKKFAEEAVSYPYGITCRNCGNKYNSESKVCPYCGCRVDTPMVEKRSREVRKAPVKKSFVVIVALTVLVMLLAGIVVYLLAQNGNNIFRGNQTSQKNMCRVINCDDEITLRESPSIHGAKITGIPLGENVEFVEEAANGFYKIKYSGKIGYCLSSNIMFKEPRNPERYPLARVVRCEKNITLRATPSQKGKELDKVDLGEQVRYICNAENGFCCVEYNGQRGFVLKAYLVL